MHVGTEAHEELDEIEVALVRGILARRVAVLHKHHTTHGKKPASSNTELPSCTRAQGLIRALTQARGELDEFC